MKGLSFHQPRAEQVVRGDKTVDVRTWQVEYRGVLAVHASGERRDGRCRALGFDPEALDYGALVGTVELTGVVALDEATYEALRPAHLLDEPFPGSPCYAWYLGSPRRFDAPLPCRGRMRLFNVDVGQAFQPAVEPPAVGPPAVGPPAVGPPAVGPPAVEPPAVEPPAVEPPAVGPPAVGQAFQPARRAPYHVAPSPEPDPDHPFVLYTIPEADNGYRVALYQWLPHNGGQNARNPRSGDYSRSAPGAMWGIELGGDPLRAVADHLLNALRANGYKGTDLARSAGAMGTPGEKPFYLDELSGLRLALILLAVKPLARHERIEAIGQGVQAMGDEEAYYWFSKCSAGPDAPRAQRALRVLLAGE